MSHPVLCWTTSACLGLLAAWAVPADAHELWIETSAKAVPGEEQTVEICWGHAGQKATGESLESQKPRLRGWVVRPDGERQLLDPAIGTDSFEARFAPSTVGYHAVVAELQAGILDKQFHGIPAKTRIVMSAKSFIHIPGSDKGLATPAGTDLDLVPVDSLAGLHPGSVVTAKVLFKGEAIGGRDVVVSLHTLGNVSFPQESSVGGLDWSVEDNAEPRSGKVSFPLIAAGQHRFHIRYTDETPGRYEGDREIATDFSHLHRGDQFDRTLYIATLTFDVRKQQNPAGTSK